MAGSIAKRHAVYDPSVCSIPRGCSSETLPICSCPDNAHYEQSDVLWFDEHNHPVEADQVDLRDQRYQQHRCYKLVSLIHVNRKLDFFFVVAARVVSAGGMNDPSFMN